MAVTVVTTSMAGAINYTHTTDSSADWGLVPVSTYFYDKIDKLVHYKDSTGAVLEIFTSTTGGTNTSAGSLILDVKINQVGGILKGQAVYVNGADGTNIEVGKADFSAEATSSKTLGLLISSGADNDQRQVITEGDLKGTGTEPLDTSAGAQGDPVWLGDDGNLIYGLINKPYAPDHLVFIGIVVQSHPIVGEIYVKVQNGFELDEIHNVDLITNPPTDGQVLTYDSITSLWKNEDLPAVIGENLNINLSPVIDNTIIDPSTLTPDYEDAYLVPIGAIGVWAGQDNNIATWDGEQWLFYTPSASDSTTVLTGVNAGYVYTFDGSIWNITITTSPGATPFYIAGSAVDAGGNKTSQIARVAGLTLGSNSGSYGSSPLTVRGAGSLENIVSRWGMGAGTATTLNNWYRIAGFTISNNTSKNYQILLNIGGRTPNTWASVTLHINLSKVSGTGKAICRVVNNSGPGYNTSIDNNFRLDESNFEFRLAANAAAGPANFRLYYKPTVLNTFMSATVLNSAGGTTNAIGIQWFNLYLGAAIEPTFSIDNLATFNYSGQRTNISATVDPTILDDANLQYTTGSLWYNTVTQKVFQCLDNTLGAAVWKQITAFDGALENINISSSQWSVIAPATNLPAGVSANGWNFFTDGANKVSGGTTSYDEYFIYAGRELSLTGTSGSANINILGVDYPINFTLNLGVTAAAFVSNNSATLLALGIQVFNNTGRLKFGKVSDSAGGSADLSAITITTTTGDLSGTFSTAINDHLVIPYSGKPYFGQRLNHSLRVNFNVVTGTIQYGELRLKRWSDDSTIGSGILITRNDDVTGNQFTFVSYTAGANDPFVTGGFYFELFNASTSNWVISGSAGILIQTSFQKPVNF